MSTISSRIEKKLNWLQHHLPEGLVVDAGWLESHGISRQLRRKYVMGGWLRLLARGVYARPGLPDSAKPLPWQRVAVSFNALLKRPAAVGARTALELQGFAHYLAPGGPREVHLYTNDPEPGWLPHLPVDTPFVFHNAQRLFGNAGAIPAYEAEEAPGEAVADAALIELPSAGSTWKLLVSTPERAILELLNEVPQRETFHQADVLMEGLRNLSPRRLWTLLSGCKSVKVKRLFLWFAERHDHAWLDQIDRSSIDLGKGKRMLVRGGRLDRRYHITVPETQDGGL